MSSHLSGLELRQLPDGTRIVVTWSGGNGPHEYTLRFDAWGDPYAETDFAHGGNVRHRLDDLSARLVHVCPCRISAADVALLHRAISAAEDPPEQDVAPALPEAAAAFREMLARGLALSERQRAWASRVEWGMS